MPPTPSSSSQGKQTTLLGFFKRPPQPSVSGSSPAGPSTPTSNSTPNGNSVKSKPPATPTPSSKSKFKTPLTKTPSGSRDATGFTSPLIGKNKVGSTDSATQVLPIRSESTIDIEIETEQDGKADSQDVFLASSQREAAPSSAQTLIDFEPETPIKLRRGMGGSSKNFKEASSSPLSEVDEEAIVQVEKVKENAAIDVDMDEDSPVRPSVSTCHIGRSKLILAYTIAYADFSTFFYSNHVEFAHPTSTGNQIVLPNSR